MGRDSTGVLTVNECQRIELSYLIKSGLLKKGKIISSVLSWTSGSRISILCHYRDNEKYIRLSYVYSPKNGKQQKYDYKIHLNTIPSNLGKGEVLYFVCPTTNSNCRILYSAYGCLIYKSRKAYNNRIYYKSQICSKYDYWLTRYYDTEQQFEDLLKKAHKSHYKGKPTKLQKRLDSLEEKLEYYEERKEDIFITRLASWGTDLFN